MGPPQRKRILLADDHAGMLEEVEGLLHADYDIVGNARNGAELVEAAQRLEPDLIISDVSMPIMSGFEAAARLRASGIRAKLIFLTVQSTPAYLKKARSVGANGYVLKAFAADHLPTAVRSVLSGTTFLCPELPQTSWR